MKNDDSKALNAYAMFLTGCRNIMEDVEFLEEMDNPTNLRTVISKLLYKTQERWRVEAFEFQEKRGKRARFADLMNFIDRQAKIAMDPLFGNISDNRVMTSGKSDQRERYPAKRVSGKQFCHQHSTENKRPQETNIKTENSIKTVSAFEKPCLYCQQPHTLVSCGKIKNQPHKEQVDFLKSKGLCFGCLVSGRLSKFCKRRMECKECSLKHPDRDVCSL